MRAKLFIAAIFIAGCSSHSSGNDITCGPGTALTGNTCSIVLTDAGADAVHDAAPADTAPADASPIPLDVAPFVDEATAFAVDPAHDNTQPLDTVASPLTPLWSASFIAPVSYALVAGGMAIVSAGDSPSTVTAFDLHNGSVMWGPLVFGDRALLAYDRGQLFVLDLRGRLSALDVVTGARRWSIEILPNTTTFLSAPVAAGGLVYINGPGTKTLAYDGATGAMTWEASAYEGSMGAPAVAAGIVYQAGVCDELYAWDAMTGSQLWSHVGTCSGGGGTTPSVFGGKVWERDGLSGNLIYDQAGSAAGTFTSDVAPAFHGGKVFYQSHGTITAVDLSTKNAVWTFTADSQICTSPVVAGTGRQVLAGARDGKVYELDEATGSQRSVYDVGAAVTCFSETSALTLGEGHLLVPAGNQLVVF